MSTSFLPNQLRPEPVAPPLQRGSNVRHKTPPVDLMDTPGIVDAVGEGEVGKRPVIVSWNIKDKSRAKREHNEGELEVTD